MQYDMPHGTETQSNASPIGGYAPASSQDTESELALNESVQNGPQASAMPDTVFYGNNNFDEDFMAQLPTKQLPESSMGDLISDAGYSLKSTDKADERPGDPSLDLTGFGTQFEVEHGQPKNLIRDLEAWIREKRVASSEPRRLFLPIDQLERCMTAGNIKLQLRHAGVREDVETLSASLIMRGKSSRQRIFAILCMIELSAQIGAFIKAGIYDTDLPFIIKENKVYSEVTEGSERYLKARLALKPAIWRTIYCEAFETHQGEISPPIFKLTWAANEKVLHFSLKDELVLPFMEVKEASQEGTVNGSTEWEGGTSFVRKVKIHAAHYNAHPDMAAKNDTYFAVKELKVVHDSKKNRSYKQDREAVALKRFHDKSHPHLIRLLATYTYRNHFNLIFPWADGNLKEFWEKRFPDLGMAREDPNIVKWISAQILGLSKALKLIHYCEIDEANPQGLTADELKRLHGRHGDLKPENILWFKDHKSVSDQAVTGVLQIGDFGFADFHSKDSRSLVRRSAVNGVTETYSAPEFDVTRQVSPQFDIWSFGCILLQFVVWYMYGWRGIEGFSSERIKDSKILIFPSDNFYSLEVGGTNGYKGRAKHSVVEMFRRLKREASNDYILDLVECIETDLLRVDNTKRAKIETIVDTFTRLDKCCREAITYCTSRTKPASRTDSGLSEIVELPEFPGGATQDPLAGVPTNELFVAPRSKTSSKYTKWPEKKIANTTNGEVKTSQKNASTVPHVTSVDMVAQAPSIKSEGSVDSAQHANGTDSASAGGIVRGDSSWSTLEFPPPLNGQTQPAHSTSAPSESASSQDTNANLNPNYETRPAHLAPVNLNVPPKVVLIKTMPNQLENESQETGTPQMRKGFRARCRKLLSKVADSFLGK
ncbi:hypothetical protein HBH56_017910 [Parastagonospora nodorum]|uniref:Protein kinase domain-containing protein n=2 Tax=Phaeosphaeria nodorum (strain SN15 / ATCC MYA-4574 / FGSC 10173) TaxID=321614 RepID=A0A7U2F2E5_PHANO|nr:hypothetical protein HBH56_017910 [Parastagonospora nodorum]QRC95224.1 hypothetical protein JI435_029270 [Parastagonospora nodorum SN15]KAH3937248.1 hypothetical protein HBH54_016590 [Parastagonospora nodorum]KAH3953690.1 hypothetical protein HBH53_028690 [Parastagonospora nodorum]KAH3962640.1 hypothetical protein HBH51_173050 [Parastagonospora nodorum]